MLHVYQQKINQLTDENVALQKKLNFSEDQKKEILADFGQFIFENAVKEKRAQKDELFQRRCQSTSPLIDVQSNLLDSNQNNYENQTPSTLNASNIILSKETARGCEEYSQSRNVQDAGTCNLALGLSLSIQQHHSETYYLLLGNTQPALLGTTLYSNYKLLLLTLAQRLLSSEVGMLNDWAAENFSIVDPQNPTDTLRQLDEKQVINAADLSQLSDFFESIVRFDLVYIIDAFLLGDYSLLRQIPASEKRNTRSAKYSQHESTSRNENSDQPLLRHPVAASTIDSGKCVLLL